MTDTPTFPNWFDGQRYNFEEQLTHLAGKSDLRFLQIGAYTGDASVWLCENILTDPTSILIDVDTWAGSDESEHSRIDFDRVLAYYEARITRYQKVVRLKMTSDKYFTGEIAAQFDFIYIDGDHTAAQVERDANSAWSLLKPGGILAFDDYLWGRDLPPDTTPKPAIDKFLLDKQDEYVQLVDSYQVWLRKNDK
jgi:predicted O-methyltransferase YrrM